MERKVRESIFLLLFLFSGKECVVKVPDLQTGCSYYYVKEGDLNLGLVTSVHKSNGGGGCATTVSESGIMYAETLVHTIDLINQNMSILPNITIGFAIMDYCGSDMNALGRSMYFLPYEEDASMTSPTVSNITNGAEQCASTGSKIQRNFDIVGLVGPDWSSQCVMIANVFSLFHIPVLGTLCTSEELSDKKRYPYFLRLVSPDSIQAEAMIDLIAHFNWTYISLVFAEGSYGENGGKHVEKQAKRRNVCIAYSFMLPSHPTEEDYEEVVKGLLRNRNARVVALFIQKPHPEGLFKAIEKAGALGYFIWVTSDGLMDENHGRLQNGAFTIFHKLDPASTVTEYAKTITPANQLQNPWLQKLWEQRFQCSFSASGNQSCDLVRNKTLQNPDVPFWAGKVIDAVKSYTYALHDMIKDLCPNAINDKSLLKDCIDSLLLLEYIKNVTFQGYGGPIKFTERGDMKGQYILKQFNSENSEQYSSIALWRPGNLDFTDEINWDIYNKTKDEEAENIDTPESVCSKPCPVKHYFIYKELPCCWECKTCRDNEIVVNASKCVICPENAWPDEKTATTCVTIDPTYLVWDKPLSLGLLFLAILGQIAVVATVIVYIKNRSTKLIKATSRELSAVLLFGIFLAYLSVFTFIARPTTWSCFCSRIGFNFSVSLIYAPLLVKTNRIYRIFAAGKKGNKRPKYIGSTSQMVITLTLLLLQVLLLVVTAFLVPPEARLEMPVRTEELVELFCHLPMDALLLPLLYNIAIIILCAIHGFTTRKLPENFNESRYICISVLTTSFLWVVFLPAYFSAFYTYLQSAILSICLILNATVTLLCLFVPKIYAIYFVREEQIKFVTLQNPTMNSGSTSGTRVPSSQNSHVKNNQIAPAAE